MFRARIVGVRHRKVAGACAEPTDQITFFDCPLVGAREQGSAAGSPRLANLTDPDRGPRLPDKHPEPEADQRIRRRHREIVGAAGENSSKTLLEMATAMASPIQGAGNP